MPPLLSGIPKDEKWMPKHCIHININAENTQSLWNYAITSGVIFSMSKTGTVAEIKSWTVLTAYFFKLVSSCIDSTTAMVQIVLEVSLHSQLGLSCW